VFLTTYGVVIDGGAEEFSKKSTARIVTFCRAMAEAVSVMPRSATSVAA
jgi:hypothetical protein